MMVVKYQWDIISKVLGVLCGTNIIVVLCIYKIIILRGSAHQNNCYSLAEDEKFVPIFLYVVQYNISTWNTIGPISVTMFSFLVHCWGLLYFPSMISFRFTFCLWHITAVFVINPSAWSCCAQVTVHWDSQNEIVLCLNQGSVFVPLFLSPSLSAQVWAVSWSDAFVCVSASFPPLSTYSLGFSDLLIVNYPLTPF